ncbi:50S ribosomal chloroplastic-like [Olea europaea subsp. europaea]|uniref:50S ribosomal chloroplastic-like n=1 Tax=Olea europaea subsp. europaea TaxID=158383 RepID=A0A8S0RYS1_OLEEU|nr:50S ribosomal chloroplastic-like [Olea europaea subsp. europaea]
MMYVYARTNSSVFLKETVVISLVLARRGKNVGLGKDHTLYSLIDGLVKFEKFGPDKKR